MAHDCNLAGCDGTRLGHELALDFPKETKRFDDEIDRILNPEDHVKPENLQVDPHHWPEALREQIHREHAAAAPTCEEYAQRGTGFGVCGKPLDELGNCANWRSHVEE